MVDAVLQGKEEDAARPLLPGFNNERGRAGASLYEGVRWLPQGFLPPGTATLEGRTLPTRKQAKGTPSIKEEGKQSMV